MQDLDATTLRRALERAGYGLAVRRDGWVEVLVSGGAERWVGRGLTEAGALADAVGQMLPSGLGRHLLAAHLAAEGRAPRAAEAAPGAEEPPPGPSEGSPPEEDPSPPPSEAAPAAKEPSPPPGEAVPAAKEPSPPPAEAVPAAKEPSPPPAEAAPAAEEPSPPAPEADPPGEAAAPAPEAAVPAAALPGAAEVEEALDELALLTARVRDAEPEVAAMADELQRLHILAWICRARSLQDRLPHVDAVERAVGDVARRLGDLGRRWWPGSVRALQVRATPLDAGAEMGLEHGGRLHDWLEAAERAEEILAARLDEAGRGRLDDEGWADRAACTPAPNAPEALLAEVRARIEGLLGSLDRAAPAPIRKRLHQADAATVAGLVDLARRLRWLRIHVDDTETWAACIGRLRWAAANLPRGREGGMQEALDPAFCPPQPWPAVLGQDPTAKRRRRQRAEILRDLPTGNGAAPAPERVAAWLGPAFELGTELPNPRIAALLYPVRDAVLGLGPDALPSNNRRTRKRLADLKARLQAMSPAEADEIRRAAQRELGPGDGEPRDAAPAEAPTDDPETVDPMDAMVEAVRRRTRGKRALFVSNREDPDLKQRLEDLLGLEVAWTVVDPRRVQSKCESIGQGSYDFVLSATGFQSHTTDSALYRASRQADVRYVRVNRGRSRACVRALARELGLE